MRCVSEVDEALSIGCFLGVRAQHEHPFTTPAETRSADSLRGGFVSAHVVEKFKDFGFGDRLAVEEEEGGGIVNGLEYGGARHFCQHMLQVPIGIYACDLLHFPEGIHPRAVLLRDHIHHVEHVRAKVMPVHEVWHIDTSVRSPCILVGQELVIDEF